MTNPLHRAFVTRLARVGGTPRVKVSIPDPLLQVAADAAQAASKKIDDLYEAAITEHVERHADAPGSLKSRGAMPRSAVKLTIELPEELFQQAEKLAKRLGMRRDVLYAVALAKHVSYDANANANTDDVHGVGGGRGLPTGRRQAGGSDELRTAEPRRLPRRDRRRRPATSDPRGAFSAGPPLGRRRRCDSARAAKRG